MIFLSTEAKYHYLDPTQNWPWHMVEPWPHAHIFPVRSLNNASRAARCPCPCSHHERSTYIQNIAVCSTYILKHLPCLHSSIFSSSWKPLFCFLTSLFLNAYQSIPGVKSSWFHHELESVLYVHVWVCELHTHTDKLVCTFFLWNIKDILTSTCKKL